MVSTILCFLAGLAAPKIYEKFTPEEQSKWKKQYPLHHGEAGVLLIIGGILSKNPGLSAFGTGLVIDDWKDRKDWFKKKTFDSDEKSQQDKKRKTITIK